MLVEITCALVLARYSLPEGAGCKTDFLCTLIREQFLEALQFKNMHA